MKNLLKLSIILGVITFISQKADENISNRFAYNHSVTAEYLNLRVDSTLTSDVLTTLPKGTRVDVLSRTDNWTLVSIKNQSPTIGFVSTKYIQYSEIKPSDIATALYLLIHLVSFIHYCVSNRRLRLIKLIDPLLIFRFPILGIKHRIKRIKSHLIRRENTYVAETWTVENNQ